MPRQFNIRNRCLPSAVLSVLVCLFHLYYASAMECGTVTAMQHQILGGSEAARAAHCIQRKNSPEINQPHDLIAYLGSHNLTAENDQRVIRANISEIHIHDDWDPYSREHDADLAILVLSRGVIFTDYIRPICLPADDVDINSATIDAKGTIVGWGLSGQSTNFTIIPRYTSLRAINESFCNKIDVGLRTFTSERTFCGGLGDGIPNYGDSGGGFFVESEHVWVQYGIVSAIRTNATSHVIPDSISVYTNIKLFKNWIVDMVKSDGAMVGEEYTFINLTTFCHYDPTHTLYGCILDDFDIQKENTVVTRMQTLVAPGRGSETVDALVFRDVQWLPFRKDWGIILKI